MEIQPWFNTCPQPSSQINASGLCSTQFIKPNMNSWSEDECVHHSFLKAVLQLEEGWLEELRSWPGHSLLTYRLLPTTTMLSSSCTRFPVGRIFPEDVASTTSTVSPAIQRSLNGEYTYPFEDHSFGTDTLDWEDTLSDFIMEGRRKK